MIGAIEAGGTKMVCAVGRTWSEVRDAEKFVVPTTTPDETMGHVLGWLALRHRETPLEAMGVASFGPLDLRTTEICESTPKVAWRGFNWRRALADGLGPLPVGCDTDTDAAGIAEWRWGAARDRRVAAYVTVGTGIGGGLIVDGRPLHGLRHPEFGHMSVPRVEGDEFPGACPSHGDCLEGLASGVALEQRWGRPAGQLPDGHPAWESESEYLAMAMVNVVAIASPEIIVLGGGVAARDGLLERVRTKTRERLSGYLAKTELDAGIAEYLVAPGLGGDAGIVGAFALGAEALG